MFVDVSDRTPYCSDHRQHVRKSDASKGFFHLRKGVDASQCIPVPFLYVSELMWNPVGSNFRYVKTSSICAIPFDD